MPNSKFNILIVDDETFLTDILGMELETEGFIVIKAHSGEEAYELLNAHPKIDLIFSDIRMPKGDGVEFLEKVKQSAHKEIPFYLISGFSDFTEEDLLKKGAEALLKKPYEIEAIIDIATKLANSKKVTVFNPA